MILSNSTKPGRIILTLLLLLIAVSLSIFAFERIPIEQTTLGFDWIGLWNGLKDGQIRYGITSAVRNPPWSLLVVLPLGFLSFRASWGLLTLLTLAVLILSIPPLTNRKFWWLQLLLLATAFPTIRHAADGNFEGLVIAGVLLMLYGYQAGNLWTLAAGVLLATAKVQEVWLLLLILAFYVLRTWPTQRWLATGALIMVVVIASILWFGLGWWTAMTDIPQLDTVVNMSLTATLKRLLFPLWLIGILWLSVLGTTLYLIWHQRNPFISRITAGLLISASLLLATYSAGNSHLTVLAIAIIPLLPLYPRAAMILLLFIDLPYLFFPYVRQSDTVYWLNVYYPTALLILEWSIFAWLTYHPKPVLTPRSTSASI